MCERDVAESDGALDHFHACRKFFGSAYSKGNLKRDTKNYIPFFPHSLSKYDFHFRCKNLHLFLQDIKIQVIPITDENYISLLISIKIASYTNRRGVVSNVYGYYVLSTLMALWLDLRTNLRVFDISLLDNDFPEHRSHELHLLHQKRF